MIEFINLAEKTEYIQVVVAIEQDTFGMDGLSEQQLREICLERQQRLLILIVDSVVVGYFYAIYVESSETCDLMKVVVLSNYRNRGYGVLLLNRLEEDLAVDSRIKRIFLEVRKSNINAIKLYEKAGYQEIGKRKNFYRNPSEAAILFSKLLRN